MGCEVESVTVGHRPVQGAGRAEMMRRRRSLSLPAVLLATRLVFSFFGETSASRLVGSAPFRNCFSHVEGSCAVSSSQVHWLVRHPTVGSGINAGMMKTLVLLCMKCMDGKMVAYR